MSLSAVQSPLVIVLTGPSGVGKDTVIDRAVARGFPLVRPPTMTTRAPREGEVEGVHHYFVSREAFLDHVARGELLEHAEVYGNLYGVPRRAVREALASGSHVVLRVDVQGAESLREVIPDALFIGLEPDDHERLRERLDARDTETAEQIERRLAIAEEEVQRARAFCRRLVNVEGDLDATVDELVTLIVGEQVRPGRERVQV